MTEPAPTNAEATAHSAMLEVAAALLAMADSQGRLMRAMGALADALTASNRATTGIALQAPLATPGRRYRSSSKALPTRLRVSEAASRLGVSPRLVQKLLSIGKLPGVKVGSVWTISPEAVEAMLTQPSSAIDEWRSPAATKARQVRRSRPQAQQTTSEAYALRIGLKPGGKVPKRASRPKRTKPAG